MAESEKLTVQDHFVKSNNEISDLISRLRKKSNRLPFYLDGFGWVGYLLGNVTRQEYVNIVGDTGDHLCRLLAYGTDELKKDLNEKYSMEVSVVLRLRKLCIDYKNGLLLQDDFDDQFLQLAREFCSDIPE